MKTSMHSRGPRIALVIVLFACAIIMALRHRATPVNDLTVMFVGLTNNPGPSVYPALSVLSGGVGLHALFGVTNVSQQSALQFGIFAIETQGGNGSSQVFPTGFRRSAKESDAPDGWRATEAGGFFTAPMGMQWRPGHGCLYAIPWPAAIAPNTPWRLRLWVRREPKPYLALFNQPIGREFFRPRGDHTVAGDVVVPFGLVSAPPKTEAGRTSIFKNPPPR